MSIAKLGLFDHLTGSLGNLIVYKVNGQVRVRSKNSSYKKSKSEAQKNQKSKFKHVAHFFSELDSPMFDTWTEATKDVVMSGYNLFIKENIRNFTPDGEVVSMEQLKICCGDLPLPTDLSMTQLSGEKILVEWQPTGSRNDYMNNDWLQIAIYDPSRDSGCKIYWHKEVIAERSDGRCEFSLPAQRGKVIYLFAYFRSQFWTKFSDSYYLGEQKS